MKLKNFKKHLAVLLVLAISFSALFVNLNISTVALSDNDIFNLDFDDDGDEGLVTKGSLVEFVTEAKEADSGKTTFSGKAVYLPNRTGTTKSNITYQMNLNKGEYTVSFDLDAFAGTNPHGSGNMCVAIYKGTPAGSNRGYRNDANPVIVCPNIYEKNTGGIYEGANIVEADGTRIKLEADTYHNLKFIGDFTIEEDNTDLFLGLCFISNDYSDYAYLDNIKVTNKDTDALFTNGDFELGVLYGYEYADSSYPPSVVKYAFDDNNVENYAAKIHRTGSAGATGRALNQKLNLPVGDYTVSFDVDVTKTSTGDALYYGVYNSDGITINNGRYYDTCSLISTNAPEETLEARDESGLNGVTATLRESNGATSYRLKFDTANVTTKATITFDITVTEENKDYLYFSLCPNTDATAYVDNIVVCNKVIVKEEPFKNGDFETGTLDGYDYYEGKDLPPAVVKYSFDGNENNYAALIQRPSGASAYGRALNQKLDLPVGNYTLTFDADVNNTSNSETAFYYGVYNQEQSDGYGRFYANTNQISKTRASDTLKARSDNELNGVYAGITSDEGSSYRLNFGNATNENVKVTITLNFVVTDENKDSLWFSIAVNNNTTAYVDNIVLSEMVMPAYEISEDYAKLTLSELPKTGFEEIGVKVTLNDGEKVISTKYLGTTGTIPCKITADGVYYCDINDDSDINETDLADLRKHLLEIPVDYNKIAVDVNADNNVDICDLVRISKIIAADKVELGLSATADVYNYFFKLGVEATNITPYIVTGGVQYFG